MFTDLTPVYNAAGAIIITHVLGSVITNLGHGDKVFYLNVSGGIICAFMLWESVWEFIRYTERMFGV